MTQFEIMLHASARREIVATWPDSLQTRGEAVPNSRKLDIKPMVFHQNNHSCLRHAAIETNQRLFLLRFIGQLWKYEIPITGIRKQVKGGGELRINADADPVCPTDCPVEQISDRLLKRTRRNRIFQIEDSMIHSDKAFAFRDEPRIVGWNEEKRC